MFVDVFVCVHCSAGAIGESIYTQCFIPVEPLSKMRQYYIDQDGVFAPLPTISHSERGFETPANEELLRRAGPM